MKIMKILIAKFDLVTEAEPGPSSVQGSAAANKTAPPYLQDIIQVYTPAQPLRSVATDLSAVQLALARPDCGAFPP